MEAGKRVILVVLDSVGIGALPDADRFGDVGANTLGHIAQVRGRLLIPHLQQMGIGNIINLAGVPAVASPIASFGMMAELSAGKDTIVGHWEMMGLPVEEPFAYFPKGFPTSIIQELIQAGGLAGVLGNKPASGTAIIEELGEEHLRTGFPIVYTSADSVLQIAAHEEIIALADQYRLCEQARAIGDNYRIGRIIARPFIGQPGSFIRTYNRKDFPFKPMHPTALDYLKNAGAAVVGIGKIENIFAGQGITRSLHSDGNSDGMRLLTAELDETRAGLIFINLVDFDMLYGHRNDVEGYATALEKFDRELGPLLSRLLPDDILMITADHGCDPAFPGTDHTREYVPLLVYRPGKRGGHLGLRRTFADVGQTILNYLSVSNPLPGTSFLEHIQ
jgi:phosphopentomutase